MRVLRFDLPYRQERPHGPPFPAQAARDREGIRRAVEALREGPPAKVYLAGHSYGGRQSTMLAAEQQGLVDALLLLSYPLHPPRKPEQLRTAHFPNLRTRRYSYTARAIRSDRSTSYARHCGRFRRGLSLRRLRGLRTACLLLAPGPWLPALLHSPGMVGQDSLDMLTTSHACSAGSIHLERSSV